MRSRIIPTIPETVLSYNVVGEKSAKLEEAAGSLNMKHVPIPTDKAGETVGFLAGYSGFASNGTEISAEGECIIFSGITSKRLDVLLKALRDGGLDIPLKAVVTQHNQSRSIEWLLEELEKERKSIEEQKK